MLSEIRITQFRNLKSAHLSLLEKGYCIIYGENGSGKTSLLEAIYVLSCGKSFRSADMTQLIENDQEDFLLLATLQGEFLGVQRDRYGRTSVKYRGEAANFSEITRMLPIRMISPIESYTLINGGPEQRRRFLDWGVFHVKHIYWTELKKLHRILKQKSAALKMRCTEAELREWNRSLVEVSYSLTLMRKEYIEKLQAMLVNYLQYMPFLQDIKLAYFPGWDESSTDLFTELSTIMKQERHQGHCLLGPHRAEIRLQTSHGFCKDQLSRGRQKSLAIALYLAQGHLLCEETGRHPLYMIDDFSSELDAAAQALLVQALNPSDKQVIITMLEENSILHHGMMMEPTLAKFYHIKKGALSAM